MPAKQVNWIWNVYLKNFLCFVLFFGVFLVYFYFFSYFGVVKNLFFRGFPGCTMLGVFLLVQIGFGFWLLQGLFLNFCAFIFWGKFGPPFFTKKNLSFFYWIFSRRVVEGFFALVQGFFFSGPTMFREFCFWGFCVRVMVGLLESW